MTTHSMPTHRWVFVAQPIRVVDGDTVQLYADMSHRWYSIQRYRLAGINTPEMKKPTRDAGEAARQYVEAWLGLLPQEDTWPLVVETYKDDVFGRWLARIWRVHDGACLNDDLLAAGHAVVFMEDD